MMTKSLIVFLIALSEGRKTTYCESAAANIVLHSESGTCQ